MLRVNYAIVFVGDMRRSVEFYRDVIGLPLNYESSHWSEFAGDGATLALHISDNVMDQAVNKPSQGPGCCRPGFSVPDLDEFHCRMLDNRVSCRQEPKTSFGVRIAQYEDPDGLVLHVSEARGGLTPAVADTSE
jgi:lactoylglutathione lyase